MPAASEKPRRVITKSPRRRAELRPSYAYNGHNAARAVLSGEAKAIPKLQSGVVEAMRAITVARRSAVKAKTQAINQLRSLLVTAPDPIRSKLMKSKPEHCVQACMRMRALGTTPLLEALSRTLRILAKRWTVLAAGLRELDAMLETLARRAAHRMLARFGVGPYTPRRSWSSRGTTPNACAMMRHWQLSVARALCRRLRERRSATD